MTRPRLLDLFCGAGGAAMGYHRAGFDVIGVDINPQPHYPFEFHQADALTYPLDGYDVIHASPPCQGYSRMRHLPWLKDKVYPLLLEPVRERLEATGLPWVIENVEDAPMPCSTVLCGWSLGLPLYRHRRFGSNMLILAPGHRVHPVVIQPGRMLNNRQRVATEYGFTGGVAGAPRARVGEAMGIDWMTRDELTQAIPPAYTERIGAQLLTGIGVAA